MLPLQTIVLRQDVRIARHAKTRIDRSFHDGIDRRPLDGMVEADIKDGLLDLRLFRLLAEQQADEIAGCRIPVVEHPAESLQLVRVRGDKDLVAGRLVLDYLREDILERFT